MTPRHHHAPRDCPVCGQPLALTRLSCQDCGTEISGAFGACDFCALGEDDREILRVFLSSRGNMKDVERHLGVSYPTARGRFDALLGRLGLAPPPTAADEEATNAKNADRLAVLEQLARGEVDVDAAENLIS
ncbi:MAG TPA: DUF2089 domain-containing protein [Acidimicrobiales bacterium]|nr:DUF2089 domain-containing protein [Acidimicrobiales bacterium]